jgi:predicted  nucleic acid-binding Zn-ribbon protein
MERYKKLKTMKRDLALVPVRDGICSGCRLQLPPQLIAEVKRKEDLLACSYCHRILYWEGEVIATAQAAPSALEKEEYDVGETV